MSPFRKIQGHTHRNEQDKRNREIRRLRVDGKMTLQQIADNYGLSKERVRMIVRQAEHEQ